MMSFYIWDFKIVIVLLLSITFFYIKKSINYFKNEGIKTLPTLPIIGNMWNVVRKKENFNETVHRAYMSFPDDKYIGFYQFHKPVIVIKDIDLIKQIAIKDFASFQDHQNVIDAKTDPLFGKNLFSLSGEDWRNMRATLSPAFTGSKMRNMFLLVDQCGNHMAEYYLKKIADIKNNDILDIEMKDAFTRYTNDVIATSAFGIQVDSLTNQNNEFYLMGRDATTFTMIRLIKMLLLTSVPNIAKSLQITLFGERLSNFFRGLVMSQMKQREENNILRQDMIHLLMEAKKGSLKYEESSEKTSTGFATVEESVLGKQSIKKQWNDDDIIAQVILFFFAGFDTSSTALSFMAYELAVNQNIQSKLQEEIDKIYKENEGKLYYDDLQKMKYLDMVVSETLRKWPPGSLTDRKCVKPYKLTPTTPDKNPYQLNIGDAIWIPVYSIHNDPKHYENPTKFDPERFSDENKHLIKQFTYIPFGIGPRNCIGSRFALMEIKSVMFHLLANFNLVMTTKTQHPLILNKKIFNLSSDGGFWIGLQSRLPNLG